MVKFIKDSGADVTVLPACCLPTDFKSEKIAVETVRLQGAFSAPISAPLMTLMIALYDGEHCYIPVLIEAAVTEHLVDQVALVTPADYDLMFDAIYGRIDDQFVSDTRLLIDNDLKEEEMVRVCMESAIVKAVTINRNQHVITNPNENSLNVAAIVDLTDPSLVQGFKADQLEDPSLQDWWNEARIKRKKGDLFIDPSSGLLYHHKRFGGNVLKRVVLLELKRKLIRWRMKVPGEPFQV